MTGDCRCNAVDAAGAGGIYWAQLSNEPRVNDDRSEKRERWPPAPAALRRSRAPQSQNAPQTPVYLLENHEHMAVARASGLSEEELCRQGQNFFVPK